MQSNAVSGCTLRLRWLYLAIGMTAMLFAGVLYAWSIWRVPLVAEFDWGTEEMSLNYTLAMCFYSVGGVLGSYLIRRVGLSWTLVCAGVLVGAGFVGASFLQGSLIHLYVCYAILAASGIGVVYNAVVAGVSAWFPDRRGLSSGSLLMCYGLSTMVFGSVFDAMFASSLFGWRKTYLIFGIAVAIIFFASGALLRMPGENVVLPALKVVKSAGEENFEQRDWTTREMLRRFTFWRAFICLTFLAVVGITTLSFAYDLALSVGAAASFATLLVGILGVCNGIGRCLTGVVFDAVGRRATMLGANLLIIAAAGTTLTAILLHSLPLCVVGFCLIGLGYGTCPTICSGVISTLYGQKYFASNYSVINFNAMASALISDVCNGLLVRFNSFAVPFFLLLALTCAAMVLNFSIRRP